MSNPIFTLTSTNPFGLSDVGYFAKPTFVDIDGDGDLDAFIGDNDGNTVFFNNTGTANAPTFAAASINPFGLSDIGKYANPTFVDIDDDGDLDAFIGDQPGNTQFFMNTGSANVPTFAAASPNPFGLSAVGSYTSPTFADIDGDGDLDAFIGDYYGDTQFFMNTGSASVPSFAAASTNPFGLNDVGSYSNPTFVDIDGDGDLDAFVGNYDGNTQFFKNTGSANAPVFAAASTNPFGLSDVGNSANPTFVDIDGDGDLDAFIGESLGNTVFFINSQPAPIAPTATNLSAAESYTEDTPLNLKDIVVTDSDSTNVTATLTLSNIAAGSLSTATSGSVTSTYNAGTGVWIASGALADVNTLLAGVTFNPALNFNANFTISTHVTDGVTTPVTGTKSFTGNAVNDAPTATNLSAAESYTEDTPLNLKDIVVTDSDSTNVTATLTLSNIAAGSLSTATSGSVTSTYNAGTGAWIASGALADVNTLLAGVTFNPALNFNAHFTISTHVTDGVTTPVTGTKSFTGNAVNDAPTVANAIVDQNATQDAEFNFIVPTNTFDDIDVGDALSYTATLGDDSPLPSWLSFDTGTQTFTGTPLTTDVGTISVKVIATDNSAASVSDLFDITVAANTGGVLLFSTAGDDILTGTSSLNDTASYINAPVPVTVSLQINTQQNTGHGLDTLTLIENLIGSNFNDELTGNSADNQLNGGAGNDRLDGKTGADTLIGGLGNDVYIVDNASDIVTENSGEGIDRVSSQVTYTLPANLENLILKGAAAIDGTGNDLNNRLNGNSAVNQLNGGAGNDRLDGRDGPDTLIGGLGNDLYIVDNIGDIVTENPGEGTDRIISTVTYTLPDNVEDLLLKGTTAIDGTGNDLSNKLIGNSAANQLSGGAGNDRLDGKGGADTMTGGLGKDIYVVDNGGDIVIENASEGRDTIKSIVTYTLPDNVEKLTLTGSSAIDGTGNTKGNTLTGNSAANQLDGDAGNDHLDGKDGNNILTGGAGKDTFQFTTSGHIDTITDFDVPKDTIQLDNTVFTALTSTGTLAADQFVIGTVALDANDFIIYDDTTGSLSYDTDGSGAGAAVQIATVGVGLSMTNADIVVI